MTEGVFEVSVEPAGTGSTIVRVTGEVDLATAPQLEEALASRPASDGLVIDLGGCTFVDSTCVRVLVGVVRETEEAGGRAALVVIDPGVLRVLEITALDTLVSVHASLDDALAHVAPSS